MSDHHRHTAIETIYARIVRLSLIQMAICSPEPDSGNSLLAQAIARRAAESGKRVLLIDLNTLAPSSHKNLKLTRNEWLPLTGNWEHALQATDTPGLTVLCCPEKSVRCVEFRDRETVTLFFDSVLNQFDLMVCDTAPLLYSGENNAPAELICAACQSTLLNVLTGYTTESQVDESQALLNNSGATLSGVIMNDRHAPSLKQELIRESDRLSGLFPKAMSRLRALFTHSVLLNQDL